MIERLRGGLRKKSEVFSFFISILRKNILQKEAKKRKTSFQIKIFILLILVSIIFQRVNAEEHSNSYLENSAITLLPQDIVFEYNSTFSKQSFTVELPHIELDVFNSFNLFFKQEGDKTDGSLKVAFLFNGTGIEFIISRLYQDQQEHNLTQAFVYPVKFNGTMNLTITCEGQTSYFHSGSLQIFCTTAIKAVEIPFLSDTTITLPTLPNSFSFRGSVASPVSRCVMTAFYNMEKLDKLNVSLSFTSISFTAFSQYVEVELNNQVIVTEEFDDGITTTLVFILPIDTGLNFLSFYFVVSKSVDIFHFTDIQIDGFIFSFEDSLPENILSYNHWEGDEIDHTFDISVLKPIANNSHQQILYINLNYGCLGSIISPAYYELYSGTEIYSGELTESEQRQSQTIKINTFTTTYDVPLLFRIHGSVEGEGIFFILNTSTIEIKHVLEFTDEATEQFESVFTKEEIILSSISETVTRTYFDVFSTSSYSTRCNISLSLTLFTETYFPVEKIDINLRVGNQEYFFGSIKDRIEINVVKELAILRGYHEVELTLVIYMSGTTITLQNVRYTLIPSTIVELPTYNNPVNDETSEPKKVINPSKPLFMGIEYGIDGLMIVIFIWHFFSKKKGKKEDLVEGGEIVELQMEGYNLHRGHYSKFRRSVKSWRLEKKVSILKTILLPISIFYLTGKIIILNFLTDQMNIIATNGIFELKSTSLGWGYLSFAVCVYLSTLELFCIFVLVTRSTFYEDYFGAIKLLGRILIFPFIISWILLFLYISRNTHSFSTWNTGLLFLCFLIMHLFSKRLGKAIIKKHEFVFYNFKKTGRMKVKLIKNEPYLPSLNPSNPLGNSSISSGKWSEKELEKYKMLLFTTIVYKIRPNVPVSPHRLADLADIPIELIEKLLLELCNNNPALGKYYHTEQVFIRHLDSNKKVLDLRNTSQRQNDENNENNYPTSKHEIIPSSNNSFRDLNTEARNETNKVNSPMKLEEQSSLSNSKLLVFYSKIKYQFKSYFTKDVLEHVKIYGTLPFVTQIVLSLFLFLPIFFLSCKIFFYNPWINIIFTIIGVFLLIELINITLRHIVRYDKKGYSIHQTTNNVEASENLERKNMLFKCESENDLIEERRGDIVINDAFEGETVIKEMEDNNQLEITKLPYFSCDGQARIFDSVGISTKMINRYKFDNSRIRYSDHFIRNLSSVDFTLNFKNFSNSANKPSMIPDELLVKLFEAKFISSTEICTFLKIFQLDTSRGFNSLELLAEYPEFTAELEAIANRIINDGWRNLAFLQIACIYSKFIKNEGISEIRNLQTFRGELPYFNVLYLFYRLAFYANRYIKYKISSLQSFDEKKLKAISIWENTIIPKLRFELGNLIVFGLGKKNQETKQISGFNRMVTTQNGIYSFNIDKLDNDWGPISIIKSELSYTHTSYTVSIKNIYDLRKFYRLRNGVDLLTWNALIEFKDYDVKSKESTLRKGFSPTYNLAEKLELGAIPSFFVDKKGTIIDLTKFNATEVYKLLKLRMLSEGYWQFFDQVSINNFRFTPQGKQVPPELMYRLATMIDILCASSGCLRIKKVFFNVDENNIDKITKVRQFSLGTPFANTVLKEIDIPAGFYISVNISILKECINEIDSNILENKTIEFAFTTRVRLQSNIYNVQPIIIYGLKDRNGKIDIVFSDYWEIAIINRDLNKNTAQGSKRYNNSLSLEEWYMYGTDEAIGKDIWISKTTDYQQQIKQLEFVDPTKPNEGIIKKAFISMLSFYERQKYSKKIRFSNNDTKTKNIPYLTLLNTDGAPIFSKFKIDMSRGLMACFDPKRYNISNIAPIILHNAREFLQRFIRTRKVPIVLSYYDEVSEIWETTIDWKHINDAINCLEDLKNLFAVEYNNIGKIDSMLSTQKESRYLYYSIFKYLRDIQLSIPLKTKWALDNDKDYGLKILYAKILDTIDYYQDLSKTPYLKIYSQTKRIDSDISTAINIIPDPMEYVHHWTTEVSNKENSVKNTEMSEFIERIYGAFYPLHDGRQGREGDIVKQLSILEPDGYYINRMTKMVINKDINPIDIIGSPSDYRYFLAATIDYQHIKTRSNSSFSAEYIDKKIGVDANHFYKLITSEDSIQINRAKFCLASQNMLHGGIVAGLDSKGYYFNYLLKQQLNEVYSKFTSNIKFSSRSTKNKAMDEFETRLEDCLFTGPFKDLKKKNMINVYRHKDIGIIIWWITTQTLKDHHVWTSLPIFNSKADFNAPKVNIALLGYFKYALKNRKTILYKVILKRLGVDVIDEILDCITNIENYVEPYTTNPLEKDDAIDSEEIRSYFTIKAHMPNKEFKNVVKILSLIDYIFKGELTLPEIISVAYTFGKRHDARTDGATPSWIKGTSQKTFLNFTDYVAFKIQKTDDTRKIWSIEKITTKPLKKLYFSFLRNSDGSFKKLSTNQKILLNSHVLLPGLVLKKHKDEKLSSTYQLLLEAIIDKKYRDDKQLWKRKNEELFGISRTSIIDDDTFFKRLYRYWITAFSGG